MKTLYVSDLDGTLLNSKAKISDDSINIINELIEKGMNFTFATARSLVSSRLVTCGLNLKLPVIVYNGTFIMDMKTSAVINSNTFTKVEKTLAETLIKKNNLHPLVYSFVDKAERVSYNINFINKGVSLYLNSRKDDKRLRSLYSDKNLYNGEVFYYTIIGKESELKNFYNEINQSGKFRVTLQQDIYNEYFWCEVMPKGASKAKAVKKLKEIYGIDKVISFGDAVNDIPMFQISDECYAVSNGVDELKNIASKEILSNDNNGVALWLMNNYEL